MLECLRRTLREAEVAGAGEELLGAVDPVGGEKFGGAQDSNVAEKFRADFILSAIAAC